MIYCNDRLYLHPLTVVGSQNEVDLRGVLDCNCTVACIHSCLHLLLVDAPLGSLHKNYVEGEGASAGASIICMHEQC